MTLTCEGFGREEYAALKRIASGWRVRWLDGIEKFELYHASEPRTGWLYNRQEIIRYYYLHASKPYDAGARFVQTYGYRDCVH